MPTFCRNVAFARIFANTIAFRIVPVFVMVALLSPAFFILFSGTAEASGRKPRKSAAAPPSAPPEPFIIGAQRSNPILTILAVEAFASIKTSVLAMFAAAPKAETRVVASVPDQTEVPPPPQPASIVDFDFDNDGKTDIGRWKPGTSEFEIDPSGGGSNLVYDIGSLTSKFVPGDFNGDGSVDAAVFDSGTWTYKTSTTATAINISLGQSGDIPVPANYDGNGATDAAVFRPSNGTWYVKQSSTGNTVSIAFGTTGDIPVVGDYDGDGLADFAVFRPSSGYWHVQGSTSGYSTFPWGLSSDVPAPADFDGDGKTDPAVYRSSTGTWYALKSSTAYATHETKVWGSFGDQPVPGDYDGDNKADFAVWRPTTGVWYIAKSSGGHEYHTLGVPGDRAVSSAYVKQIGGEVAPYDLAKARLSPKNATGGTDLYSQNFSWGTSLVGLPGRAGLNAGFGMSYNSLVWTKEGSNVHFDTNYDNISPGFRFGFPTIEAPYYIEGGGGGETSDPYFAYVMVSPSGARTEFRQVGASELFETADSSYLQLETASSPDPNTPVEEIALTVRGTDGTQMSYIWIAGAFRCTRILDRNGNYITIDNSEYGQLTKVTDTLGREINVNYSEDLYPTSITQTWKTDNGLGSNVTHTWATFAYANVTLNPTWHNSITSTGPPAGTILKVLDKVTYPDLSSTKFYYNAFGQVSKIENIAADLSTHILNSVRTNLETPGSNLTDVPRLGETRTFVENFNSGNETVVTNTIATGHQVTDISGATVTASLIQVGMTNHPTGNVTNTYVGESDWMEGLPIVVNDYAAGNGLELMRSSWTKWTQDDVNSADVQNPRVTETKIGDGTNLKRSTIDYLLYPSTTVSKFGLVNAVNVYDTNQSTVLKRAETDYNLTAAYLDRRIIGVPSETRVFGVPTSVGSLELVSRMTYGFDEGNFAQEQNQIITPVRHETGKYDEDFIVGRGNMTSTTRHDVTGQTASVTSRVLYDIAGSPVAQFDPVNRQVRIEYTDVFNDTSTTRNTFAYPTKVYDPAGNHSEVKYRHDIGANVWAQSPAPDGQITGKITERRYDDKGRLLKNTIVNNGAYTRYDYPTNGNSINVFSTVTDADNNGQVNSIDEVLSESIFDGAGRLRMKRSPMLFDSSGNATSWVGQKLEYDLTGRVKRQSVPTEIDSSWAPTGDDQTRGWQWTSVEFDWKGRKTREIGLDNIDKLYSYEGCGCAGGEIVTIRGESLAEGRRTQKIYADILGRAFKTEILNWNGDVYSTTVTAFNGRDQAVSVKQYEGTESSQTYQETIRTYDGHGRLETQHLPQQNTAAATTYSYNADDQPSSVTDGRGAVTGITYDNRSLVERVDYSLPGASQNFPTINPNGGNLVCSPEDPDYPDCLPGGPGPTPEPTPNPQPYLSSVTFEYDSVGNRTRMIDSETGTTTYDYDQLSRMTAEHKILRAEWTIPEHEFDILYTYSLNGQLATVTDPFGDRIDYATDKIGRLKEISGTPFSSSNSTGATVSVTDYIDNIEYRAWGAVKSMDYGNSTNMSQTFDSRLRVEEFRVRKDGETNSLIKKNFQYYDDNKIKFSSDSGVKFYAPDTHRFDRSYSYDHMGRLTAARTGAEARGETTTPDRNTIPYKHDYAYNVFGNVESRQTFTWTEADNKTHVWANDRESIWGYDADGRLKSTPENRYYYDASGEVVMSTLNNRRRVIRHLDGEGKAVRTSDYNYSTTTHQYSHVKTEYFIYSTVLGKLLTEVKSNGTKKKTNIYGIGGVVATQNSSGTTAQHVAWENIDPSSASYIAVLPGGSGLYGGENRQAELDPLRSNVGTYNPYETGAPENIEGPGTRWGDPFGGYSCRLDGFEVSCSQAMYVLSIGAGDIDFRHSDGWALGNLGITWRVIPGNNDAPVPPGGNPNSAYGTRDRYEYHIWGPNRPNPVILPYQPLDIRVRTWHESARDFLKDNPDCARFIESLLSQLQKDTGITLEGDINHFIDQMEKSGLLETEPAGGPSTGGYSLGRGETFATDYGTPGWGFYIQYQSQGMGNMNANNSLLYLSELIHVIGRRGGVSHFSDGAAAKALETMGIAMSEKEFSNLPHNASKEKYNDGTMKFAASWLWHPILNFKCGYLKTKPPGMR